MEEMYVYKNQKKLRWGYTTGTCGTAASMAAALMLLGQKRVGQVKVSTPKGLDLDLEIEEIRFTKEQAVCAVRKDSGDDPDVTNGIAIYSRVSFRDDKPETEGYIWENEVIRLHLTAGEGVGIVTKPGLACEVGKPAINPVPREMIFTHVERACRQYGFQGSLHIEIFIPQGIEISKKTFNPRMGIKGGISLLGTSGMVEPMSEKALTDTIQLELHQKHVAGLKSMILTPGNYGESFLRDELNVNLDYAVKCSNFIGDSLDMAVQENIEEVLLVGHGGKLIKLAAGVMNTHSSVADGRMETLAAWGGACGAGPELIREILESVTVDQGLKLLETVPGLREKVMEQVVRRAWEHLTLRAGESMKVECILFTNERGILGMSPGAMDMLKRILAQDMTNWTEINEINSGKEEKYGTHCRSWSGSRGPDHSKRTETFKTGRYRYLCRFPGQSRFIKRDKTGGCDLRQRKNDLEQVMEVIEQAWKEQKEVVRLHTGDPCLYGAIREQMDAMDKLGITYDICPGVSSFCGTAAALQMEYTLPGNIPKA